MAEGLRRPGYGRPREYGLKTKAITLDKPREHETLWDSAMAGGRAATRSNHHLAPVSGLLALGQTVGASFTADTRWRTLGP